MMEWRGGPDNGCKLWGSRSQYVTVSKVGVANAKAGQGDLLMTVPVAGRLPRNKGRSQLNQFIDVRNSMTPAGLLSGADGTLKCTVVVPKGQGEVDVWGMHEAWHP